MQCLYQNLTREEIEAYGLVLSAAGLTYIRILHGENRWSLWIETTAFETARHRIEDYRGEDFETAAPAAREGPARIRNYSAAWVCLMLLAAFLASGTGPDRQALVTACGASAGKIVRGEIFRTATALMIHASAAHLAGNLAGVALFGTAVCSIAGTGAGWLMILLTGILGNTANAFLFRTAHVSVGASTAVFGAVGWLAAYQFQRKMQTPDRRIKAWLPLAGGLALLGFLGAGRNADLTAHFFGFAAGFLFGLAYARVVKSPPGGKVQALCLAAAVVLLAGAWYWARISA